MHGTFSEFIHLYQQAVEASLVQEEKESAIARFEQLVEEQLSSIQFVTNSGTSLRT